MGGLRPDQLAFYLENGYLLVEDLLPPADLQPLIDEISEVIDREARGAYAAGRLRDLFEDEPFDRRMTSLRQAMGGSPDIGQAVMGKRHRTAGMFRVVAHPAILDIVESVIGPEVLAHPQFNCQAKMPREEKSKVPWHQDLGFLDPVAEGTFMVNFWIPLVDATVENGCLEVISGSHRAGLRPHGAVSGYSDRGMLAEYVPPGERVSCPIRKGGVVMFQHKTAHRSFPNRTDRIRWSLDIRYSDPRLPSGRDAPGFIARSRAHPESVARSHLDWLKVTEGFDLDRY